MNKLIFYFLKIIFFIYNRNNIYTKIPLDSTKGLIIASNHQSHLDALFFNFSLKWEVFKRVEIVSKKENLNGLFGFGLRLLCLKIISLDRKGNFWHTLDEIRNDINHNKIIFAHPEGTRSEMGELLPFKNGLALLAYQTKTPLLPVYIDGTHRVLKKHALFPKPYRVKIYIGSPIQMDSYLKESKGEINLKVLGKITFALRKAVLELKQKTEKKSKKQTVHPV